MGEQGVYIADVAGTNAAEVTSNGNLPTKAKTARPRELYYRKTQTGDAYLADTQLQEGINDNVSVTLTNNTGSKIEVAWLNPFSTVLTSWELALNPTTTPANDGTTRQIGSGWGSDSDVDFKFEAGTSLSGGTPTGIDILSRAQKDREWLYAPIADGNTLGIDTNVQNLSGDSLQFSIGYVK